MPAYPAMMKSGASRRRALEDPLAKTGSQRLDQLIQLSSEYSAPTPVVFVTPRSTWDPCRTTFAAPRTFARTA
jgi:hypothetical protein